METPQFLFTSDLSAILDTLNDTFLKCHLPKMFKAQALEKAGSPANHLSVNSLKGAADNIIFPKYLLTASSRSFSGSRPSLIVFRGNVFPVPWVLSTHITHIIFCNNGRCHASPHHSVLLFRIPHLSY